jgi:hypothetical protein
MSTYSVHLSELVALPVEFPVLKGRNEAWETGGSGQLVTGNRFVPRLGLAIHPILPKMVSAAYFFRLPWTAKIIFNCRKSQK